MGVSKLRAQQGFCLDLTFKVESVPGGWRGGAAQLREDAVFKWARSGSRGEMTRWSEPWLKAPPLSVRPPHPPCLGKTCLLKQSTEQHRRTAALPCVFSGYRPMWSPRPGSSHRSLLPLRGTEETSSQCARGLCVCVVCLCVCSLSLVVLNWFIHGDPTLTKASASDQTEPHICNFVFHILYIV